MALLHACGWLLGQYCPKSDNILVVENGQYMVLSWNNIRRFYGNIKSTKSDNILCYYILSKCEK